MNSSAPQNFRVIDTKTGEIIPPHNYFVNHHGELGLVSKYGQPFTTHHTYPQQTLNNHIASGAIDMKDSKGVEIYTGDVGERNGILYLVCFNQAISKYVLFWLDKNDPQKDLRSAFIKIICPSLYYIPIEENDFTIIGNIWQPKYRKFLDKLTETK